MSSTDQLHLVFAADENFVMPLAVSVHSALAALRGHPTVCVHVFDGGFSPASRARLEAIVARSSANANICWIVPEQQWLPELKEYRFANTSLNETTFFRLAMPQALAQDCERVIYLDSDLVVQHDLGELAAQIVDEAPIVAIRDYGIPTFGRRFRSGPVAALNEWDPCAGYFNAGVLGVNLKWWRQQRVAEEACEVIAKHPRLLRFNDQDALNIVLHAQWREVDLAWNLQTHGPDRIRRLGGSEIEFLGEPYDEIRKRAKIIHFSGNKPWNQGFTNPDRPAFVEALRESGWFSPVEFRLWQAKWWGQLARRTAPKALGAIRGRIRSRAPGRATAGHEVTAKR